MPNNGGIYVGLVVWWQAQIIKGSRVYLGITAIWQSKGTGAEKGQWSSWHAGEESLHAKIVAGNLIFKANSVANSPSAECVRTNIFPPHTHRKKTTTHNHENERDSRADPRRVTWANEYSAETKTKAEYLYFTAGTSSHSHSLQSARSCRTEKASGKDKTPTHSNVLHGDVYIKSTRFIHRLPFNYSPIVTDAPARFVLLRFGFISPVLSRISRRTCRVAGADADQKIFVTSVLLICYLVLFYFFYLLPRFADGQRLSQFVFSWHFAWRVQRNFTVWQPGVFIQCDSPTRPWRQGLLSSCYSIRCCFIMMFSR